LCDLSRLLASPVIKCNFLEISPENFLKLDERLPAIFMRVYQKSAIFNENFYKMTGKIAILK
jgi:hypothetical protein